MLIKKYNSIMAGSEDHRNKWAISLTVCCSVLIFVSFAFYKGYLSFAASPMAKQKSETQVASVVSSKSAPTPIENTKKTFEAAFSEIGKQYREFTDSVSAVVVPFVTGIEVYERK